MSELFPPFMPDPDEPKRKRFQPIPFRLLAPNLVTLLALCLGLTAIRLVVEDKLEVAVVCILVAAALDGVDGRLARFLKGTSRFGAELDSLADFVNFGVATSFTLYIFVLKDLKSFGWIVALIFAIAMALRLARFNAMLDDPTRPDWQKDFFVGMPAPAGAITVMLPLYLHFLGLPLQGFGAPFVAIYILGIAFLTISKIPMFAGKSVGTDIPRERVLPIFVIVVLAVALLVAYPFEMLTVIVLTYLTLIPMSISKYRALEKANARPAGAEIAPSAPDPDMPNPA